MTILLELLKEVFPENELFPSSYRDAWKIVKDLGLSYHKILACPNDCLIYWKETEHETFCRKCGTPRYKQIVKQSDDSSEQANKVPAKLVRYFPLKPRLQRLFMSSKTASLMRWHEEERIKDGKLRHPADSLAWKHFNDRHPSFASDPRNVRVGLAADGFNPFKAMNNKYSTWPVILVPYNLPSWMCMKQTSFMLCLLIDGPKAPGNDIHVYLQPVIDELNEFWDPGVPTYDAASKQILWPILVDYWSSEDVKKQSKINSKNRKKQKMPHRTGRKDHVNLREELRIKTGKEPSKLDVFIHSRQGKQMDELTSQTIATMNEEIQKLPETSRDDNFVKDILYENILGPEKPGRLRTYGVGATPKDVYRMSDNMNDGQKKAFEDAVNEKVEIIRGELREEMNSKLADFKEELIAQFEARMRASTCDLASLQRREMNAAKQSQISDSLEVGDRMNREVGTNDAEMYKEVGTNDAEINKCEMNKKVSSIADILENHHTKKKRSRTTCKRLA
ncbi:uncharacterized protein LOC113767387 [Coffea eugenioides]|nr:uncharacterized protein LOC113767387 [Coffea eugenioides]